MDSTFIYIVTQNCINEHLIPLVSHWQNIYSIMSDLYKSSHTLRIHLSLGILYHIIWLNLSLPRISSNVCYPPPGNQQFNNLPTRQIHVTGKQAFVWPVPFLLVIRIAKGLVLCSPTFPLLLDRKANYLLRKEALPMGGRRLDNAFRWDVSNQIYFTRS